MSPKKSQSVTSSRRNWPQFRFGCSAFQTSTKTTQDVEISSSTCSRCFSDSIKLWWQLSLGQLQCVSLRILQQLHLHRPGTVLHVRGRPRRQRFYVHRFSRIGIQHQRYGRGLSFCRCFVDISPSLLYFTLRTKMAPIS